MAISAISGNELKTFEAIPRKPEKTYLDLYNK